MNLLKYLGKGNAGIHLIVGLGETEKEAVDLMWYAHSKGARITLFAFYPESGTPMGKRKPVSLNVYRRMQLVRWLIENDLVKYSDLEFNEEGKLVNINIPSDLTIDEIAPAFQTSGCPGCNRPYSNERPSMRLRNIPWYPQKDLVIKAIKETKLEKLINKLL